MYQLLATSEMLFSNFQQQLLQAKNSHDSPLRQSQAALPICIEYIRELKRNLKSFQDIPTNLEIEFFKNIKPKFVSEYLFHALVYNLHSGWPMGNVKKQQQYLEEKQDSISDFFDKNQHFYCYHRTQSTLLDNTYFLRGQLHVEPSPEHLICGMETSFYTPKDLLLAQLLANDRFQDYLDQQARQLHSEKETVPKQNQPPALVWSESKYAFIELVYGLHLSRAFNGGQSDIKTIVAVLGKTFGLELKNVYDHFRYIKMRKLQPTKFMDKMKTSLLQKFNEQFPLSEKQA